MAEYPGGEITSEQASEAIKGFAERHKVRIELTEEQLKAIIHQWDDDNPREPAQITFFVEGRAFADLRVAGYRYRGDTCCA